MGLREELIDMKKEVENLHEQSLAMELVKDFKKQNKRQFIIILVILTMWLCTIGAFVYYICNYDYVEETYTTDLDTNTNDSSNGSINIDGDVRNG